MQIRPSVQIRLHFRLVCDTLSKENEWGNDMKNKLIMAAIVAVLFTGCEAVTGSFSTVAGLLGSTSSQQSSSVTEQEQTSSFPAEQKPESVTSSADDSESDFYASDSAVSSGTDLSETSSSQAPTSESAPLTMRFTLPEGSTLAKLGLILEDKGVCTAEELIQAAAGDFSEFPLIAAQKPDKGRCFDLEGYLFPDTYEIYNGETPDAILRRMLAHTEQVITPAMREQIAASGYTVHEILAMASIIEKEAFGAKEMPNISSVLHNRLETGMRLQCDVTIKYVEGAIKPFITGDINRYNASYNTYKCSVLPAGPICNPGLAAIKAAIAPADTPYLFFLTDSEQNYLYAETFEAHQENEKKAGL